MARWGRVARRTPSPGIRRRPRAGRPDPTRARSPPAARRGNRSAPRCTRPHSSSRVFLSGTQIDRPRLREDRVVEVLEGLADLPGPPLDRGQGLGDSHVVDRLFDALVQGQIHAGEVGPEQVDGIDASPSRLRLPRVQQRKPRHVGPTTDAHRPRDLQPFPPRDGRRLLDDGEQVVELPAPRLSPA